MKRFFKKSIAYLIAALMVISTMPFTAITASAAVSIPSGLSASTANATPETFTKQPYFGTSAISGYYGNLVYSSTTWNPSEKEENYLGKGTGMQANIAMVYTGVSKETYAPVIASFWATGSSNVQLCYTRLNWGSQPFSLEAWTGYKNTTWSAKAALTVDKQETLLNYQSHDANRLSFTTKDHPTPNYMWWTKMYYTGSGNTSSYYDKYTNPTFEIGHRNEYWGWKNRYWDSTPASNIYVINYKPAYDILNNTAKVSTLGGSYSFKELYNKVWGNEDAFETSTVNAYYNAVNALVNLNVNGYFDSATDSNIETQVSAASTAIKNAVSNYNSAAAALVQLHVHTYSEWAVETAGTCTVKTVEERHCTAADCDDVNKGKETRETSVVANNHTALAENWTATVGGTNHYKLCGACGNYVYEDCNSNTLIPGTEPTCTEDGLTDGYKCSACGRVTVEQTTRPASSHDYGNWITDTPATCTTPGTKHRNCKNCPAVDNDTIPVDASNHTGAIVKVSDGDSTHHQEWNCCNAAVADSTEAHSFSYTSNEAEGHSKTCACGYTVANEAHTMADVANTAQAATCEVAGKNADQACQFCDYEVTGSTIDPLTHDYGEWTYAGNKQHTRVCGNDASHVETVACTIVRGVCTECDELIVDFTAYDAAVAAVKTNGTGEYTAESFAAYQAKVNGAIIADENNATQEQVNKATATITEALELLRNANITVTFIVYDENGTEVSRDPIPAVYGEKVTLDAQATVSKWVVSDTVTGEDTKLDKADSAIDVLATRDQYVRAYKAKAEVKDPEKQYAKVNYHGKNGVLIAVKYIEKQTKYTLATLPTVEAPSVSFYSFGSWTLNGITYGETDEIDVYANYMALEDTQRCCIHLLDGTVITRPYDSYVYLGAGATDKNLALSKTADETDILTYITGDSFYAPSTNEIYVIEVAAKTDKIAITGSYALTGAKGAVFNAKFYANDMSKVQEYGVVIINPATGAEKIVKANSASENNEYSVKVTLPSTSTLTSLKAKAYVVIDGTTIYSDVETQTL